MTDHKTGSREEWPAARLELLDAEKELTRRGDELARMRRELPWVPIEKNYRFETDEGPASLADLSRRADYSSLPPAGSRTVVLPTSTGVAPWYLL